MKATGEIMAIGRNFEESILKGIRSLEIGNGDFHLPYLSEVAESILVERLIAADDERIFVLEELLRSGMTIEAIHSDKNIDYFFMNKFIHIIVLVIILKKNNFYV